MDSVYVHHMVETNGLATIGQLSFGSLVRASSPVLCSIETYEDGAFKHIRFTRPARENAGEPEERNSKRWPRLRLALQKAGTAPLHFIGGFQWIPLYGDEIAINDYSVDGSYGWIVRSRDVPELLETVPLDEKGLKAQKEKVAYLEQELRCEERNTLLRSEKKILLLKKEIKKAQRGLVRR